MCQPWLTQIDWPVSALVLKAARNSAISATSSTVVNSLSTVSASMISLTTRSSLMPSSLRLLGDLLLDERRLDEARADDIGAHAMRGAFLGHHPREAEQAVLGRHIGAPSSGDASWLCTEPI